MTLLLEKDVILNCLRSGEMTLEGQFRWGSNYTFLCEIQLEKHKLKAVYKPVRGERPLWDFPSETLAGREAAAYLVSEAGGWDFVPPTVFRSDAPEGPGSLQLFIRHDPEYHYFKFSEEQRQRLRPAALFDCVINNTDRKGGHILMDDDQNIWLIDHGICFHSQPKLRTVIWDFAGQPIPEEGYEKMAALRKKLLPGEAVHQELLKYLNTVEILAIIGRIDGLTRAQQYPRPVDKRYSYPWPPV